MNSIHIKIRDSQPGENSINSIYTIKQLKSKTGQKNDKYSIWYPDHDTEIVIMRNYLETYWEG